MNTRLNGKATLLALGLMLVLGACSASAVPSGASNVKGATSAVSQQAPVGSAAPPTAVVASREPGVDASAACSLVTSSAVSTAAGFAVAKSSGAAGQCIFQNADSSQYLTVLVYGNQADMAVMLEAEPGGQHIAGLGDDAFWSQLAGMLFVRKGDHAVTFLDPDLGASSPTDTTGRDALVALARTALPNL
jgi:hypothetical protein